MKKLLLILSIFLTGLFYNQLVFATPCEFGTRCVVNNDLNQEIIYAIVPISSGPQNYHCLLESTDTSVILTISASPSASGLNIPNLPEVNGPQGNEVYLIPNTSVPFILNWQYPGEAHPGITSVYLSTTLQQESIGDAKMFITCNHG